MFYLPNKIFRGVNFSAICITPVLTLPKNTQHETYIRSKLIKPRVLNSIVCMSYNYSQESSTYYKANIAHNTLLSSSYQSNDFRKCDRRKIVPSKIGQ